MAIERPQDQAIRIIFVYPFLYTTRAVCHQVGGPIIVIRINHRLDFFTDIVFTSFVDDDLNVRLDGIVRVVSFSDEKSCTITTAKAAEVSRSVPVRLLSIPDLQLERTVDRSGRGHCVTQERYECCCCGAHDEQSDHEECDRHSEYSFVYHCSSSLCEPFRTDWLIVVCEEREQNEQ